MVGQEREGPRGRLDVGRGRGGSDGYITPSRRCALHRAARGRRPRCGAQGPKQQQRGEWGRAHAGGRAPTAPAPPPNRLTTSAARRVSGGEPRPREGSSRPRPVRRGATRRRHRRRGGWARSHPPVRVARKHHPSAPAPPVPPTRRRAVALFRRAARGGSGGGRAPRRLCPRRDHDGAIVGGDGLRVRARAPTSWERRSDGGRRCHVGSRDAPLGAAPAALLPRVRVGDRRTTVADTSARVVRNPKRRSPGRVAPPRWRVAACHRGGGGDWLARRWPCWRISMTAASCLPGEGVRPPLRREIFAARCRSASLAPDTGGLTSRWSLPPSVFIIPVVTCADDIAYFHKCVFS